MMLINTKRLKISRQFTVEFSLSRIDFIQVYTIILRNNKEDFINITTIPDVQQISYNSKSEQSGL